ncbi:MAG: HAMP domain-containing histidine kinase [Ruminococcaceae bacterium]|nr:HAMP domain-containing histidine kinase [Oscillospiraceae bacterium]
MENVTDNFSLLLKDTLKISDETRVMIFNEQSDVIYDSASKPIMLQKTQIKKSVITALNGEEGAEFEKNKDKTITYDASVPIFMQGNPQKVIGAVNVSYTTDKNANFIASLTNDMIILFVVVTLIMGLIICIIANLITKRIVNFTAKITEMSDDGVLDEALEIKGNDEVAKLGVAFNTMRDKLLLVEKKRTEFVSSASHELRTPLSAIKLMSDSILQNPDIDIEYVREFLIDITGEVDRLNRIVDKLLYLTKLDTEKSNEKHLNLEFIDARPITLDIIKNLSPIAEEKNIIINSDYCESVFIMADKDKLWQGIYNIIDNAIKYSGEGGQIVVGITKFTDYAQIAVKDNGIGISKDEIEKIFDRFYRVDKARARATGGTGLGLSIANESINMMGGKIEVQSEEGVGTTFFINMPLYQ